MNVKQFFVSHTRGTTNVYRCTELDKPFQKYVVLKVKTKRGGGEEKVHLEWSMCHHKVGLLKIVTSSEIVLVT